MKCRQIHNLLNAYCDHELSSEQFEKVSQHLDHCTDCRNKMQSLQYLNNAMNQVLSPEPSEGFTADVMSIIRKIPSKRSPFSNRWVPALSYSLTFVTLLFLGLLWNPLGVAEKISSSGNPSWVEFLETEESMHLSQLQDFYLNSLWSETNETR